MCLGYAYAYVCLGRGCSEVEDVKNAAWMLCCAKTATKTLRPTMWSNDWWTMIWWMSELGMADSDLSGGGAP